jgi:hypothetical protein
LQRFSSALFLFFYFTIFISRLRLTRSSFFTIFFSADNMFIAVFTIFIRPATGQTTIDNNKASFSLSKDCKLFLSGHKIDKTVSRLRHG